jgi:hypothetical protein
LIGWTAPTDDGGSPQTIDYQVWSDNGLGLGYTLIVATTNGLTSYTMSTVTGRTYFFKIRATNVVGQSSLTSSSLGMLAGSIPTQPLLPTLVSQSQFRIQFSWTAPTNLGGIPLTQYSIFWDLGNTGTTNSSLFVLAGTTLPANLIYTQNANIASGVVYQFYVVAQNQVGSSPISTIIRITAATPPLQITSISTVSQS